MFDEWIELSRGRIRCLEVREPCSECGGLYPVASMDLTPGKWTYICRDCMDMADQKELESEWGAWNNRKERETDWRL